MIQAELMKNDVFDARMKIKRRIQWYSGTKMTKKCVKIAYRSEIDKKEVKIGRVGLLPSISHTRVKAYVGRKLAYTGPFPHMQSLKNKAAYI